MATSLMLLTNSCGSVKIEYVYDVPNVVFPAFPDPEPVTVDEKTGIVTMPLDYYVRIAEYKRDVDKVQAQLERIRELYDTEKKDR
ncbi:MAG: hypothetical protein IJ191_09155 [Treponema sp.]|nr:hypothetical protein [Treponema sp.]